MLRKCETWCVNSQRVNSRKKRKQAIETTGSYWQRPRMNFHQKLRKEILLSEEVPWTNLPVGLRLEFEVLLFWALSRFRRVQI